MNTASLASVPMPEAAHDRALGTALWLFIGVATTLFMLFLTAYAMRMDTPDWSPVTLPPQLWLSTAALFTGSLLMHRAGVAAHASRTTAARRLLLAAGAAAVLFLGVQLWAWQALLDARVVWANNPAASFFYLLTAMHGLHVCGGLVGWGVAAQALAAPAAGAVPAGAEAAALRVSLCARYWHFLLALWLLLFAALGWLTPEIVRAICGTG